MKRLVAVVLLVFFAGCSAPKAILPPVGNLAAPEIHLAPRPVPPVFTEQEFAAMPITAQGKILKFKLAWDSYANIADLAVKQYRDYLKGLFAKDKK